MSDKHTKEKPTRYALFAWEAVSNRSQMDIYSIFITGTSSKDSDEQEDGDEDKKPKRRLAFVDFCSTPAEVIAAIRKDVGRSYVLMTGTVDAVQVATPVFVAGRNLATLDKEWAELPEAQP